MADIVPFNLYYHFFILSLAMKILLVTDPCVDNTMINYANNLLKFLWRNEVNFMEKSLWCIMYTA